MPFDGRMLQEVGSKQPLDGAALESLMQAVARDRDRQAFVRLFDHFGPRLKAYLLRMGTDSQQAEELVQEAMIMVWQRAESFDPQRAAVSTWVFTIARNKRIDALRRERRPEIDPNDPALMPAPQESADEVIGSAQTNVRLSKAIEELPPEQAELVRMAYFEDKPHVKIAEETKLPLGTVKSRLRLALGRLRKTMKEMS